METVKIRLRKPRRVLTFLSHDQQLRRDDPCIVQTDRGLEYGVCVLPPEPCPAGLEKRLTMSVVRKASDTDEDKQGKIREEESTARGLCLKKIRKHELPMKLVDAEYTFDKRKIIFYFTAEDRVDFRELVRDLARDLRARIELRHIQVRDEAKAVGGIGSCGRELCCTTFLNEFKPISMRMAKRQNLSLNPSKISGQCGRLMCCLSYENDLYHAGKQAHEVAKERVEKVVAKKGDDDSWEPMPEVIFNKARPDAEVPREAVPVVAVETPEVEVRAPEQDTVRHDPVVEVNVAEPVKAAAPSEEASAPEVTAPATATSQKEEPPRSKRETTPRKVKAGQAKKNRGKHRGRRRGKGAKKKGGKGGK